ncbi:hypothetical protein G7Y79_00021g050650 [Physcia stellaris]|nr:hypothetical protein G7Y79_00021g050650 [Physcia stellaris]
MPRASRHPKSHHVSPQPAHSAPHQPHPQSHPQVHPPQPNYTHLQSSTISASPAPPPRTNASLNLSVLQQHYPSTSQILTLAPFSVLYTFSPTTQSWEKCEVEGTLFVCALSTNNQNIKDQEDWEEREEEEGYAVVILNRKGLDNFYLEISAAGEGAVEVEITAEFTILQAADKVWGLWIYGEAGEGTSKTIAACAERVRTHAEEQEEDGDVDAPETAPHLPTLNHATAHHQQHPSISSPSPPPPPPPPTASKPHVSPPDIPLDTKPERPALPMFTPSADTQFFLSQGRGGLQQISRGRPPIAKESGEAESSGGRKGVGEDTLGALFAKAEREYLGKERGRL